MGNESGHWTTAKRFSGDLFVLHSDSFPHEPRKKTLIPYIYNASNKYLSKILREKLQIQNSHYNGHLISFDIITLRITKSPDQRTFLVK